MSFTSPFILFYFLPIFLVVFFLLPMRYKKVFLWIGSIIFYAWEEPQYFLLMPGLILFNFLVAGQIEKSKEKAGISSGWLYGGIAANLSVLLYFKTTNHFPIGLSFLTFQTIGYLIDVFKHRISASNALFDFSLTMFLFPKVISGPITSYRELIPRLNRLNISLANVSDGLRRFSIGLAKKILIADALSESVNRIFNLSTSELTTAWAWYGILAFAVQIYFDFSGYTDMAIGLGQALGFKLPDNFNYPYLSRSITEFWRRWHITLSNWFRDYLFYPLERKRKLAQRGSQAISTLIVFSLTGLWHGISDNFLAWGIFQALLIIFEQSAIGKRVFNRLPRFLQHFYGVSAILMGWVLFRTSDLPQAAGYFAALAGFGKGDEKIPFGSMPLIENYLWITVLVGILFSFPVIPFLFERMQNVKFLEIFSKQRFVDALIIILVFVSIVFIIASKSQMSLYAKF